MSEVVIGTGAQAGLTVSEVIDIAADNWGGNPSGTRFKNLVKRRINQALRDIWRYNPNLKHYNVYDAAVNLIAGQATYDVRKAEVSGGFGWTACFQVLDLVFNTVDNRPLEKLNREQFRERSELFSFQGSPERWFPIHPWEVAIFPTPNAVFSGTGDYVAEIPSITDDAHKLDWARGYDQAIVLGVDWYFARIRRPREAGQFKQDFYNAVAEIETIDHTDPARPQHAAVTRNYRSGRRIPTDNSTDRRYYR
jgi:hypothetical protein